MAGHGRTTPTSRWPAALPRSTSSPSTSCGPPPQRAFEQDPAGTFTYGTSAGYPRLLEWIAAKHEVEPDRLLATNGSMQADTFLFDQLVDAGRSGGGRGADLRPHAARAAASSAPSILAIPLQADGIDVGALATALEAGARPKLAHIIPNFQNPAGCTLSLEKRQRLIELARRARLPDLRGRPLRRAALRGRAAADDAGARGERGARGLRLVLLQDRLPGHPRGLPGRAGGADQGDIRKRGHRDLHLAEHGGQSIVAEFCHSGAIDELDRRGQGGAARAPRRHLRRARARAARCPLRAPEGGYFLWVDLPEGSDVAALERGRASAEWCS